jgi:carbonic anhydrase/acetyltransferase-like protein (isoleucine patch superfamily)
MGATLLDGCEIGEGAIVAAGALVLQNTKVGAHEIWGGVPAKYIKPTRPGQTDNAEHYVAYAKTFMKENPECRFTKEDPLQLV